MTTFRTCYGCKLEKKPCDVRKAFATRISLLGITSVKWNCVARELIYKPGDLVWAQTVVWGEGDGQSDPPIMWYHAVVIRYRKARSFIVLIEPDSPGFDEPGLKERSGYEFSPRNSGRGYCKIPLGRLRPREGTRENVCPVCERIPRLHGHESGHDCPMWINAA